MMKEKRFKMLKRDAREKKDLTKKGAHFKKDCGFCKSNLDIDYKNIELISRYVSSRGKILSRRISGSLSFFDLMASGESVLSSSDAVSFAWERSCIFIPSTGSDTLYLSFHASKAVFSFAQDKKKTKLNIIRQWNAFFMFSLLFPVRVL